MNNKIHVLCDSKNYGISSQINTKDYVMMHKAELESIIMNTDIFNWFAESSDKLGAFFLGVGLTLYGTSNYTIPEILMALGFGLFLTASGIYYKYKRKQKIDLIINDKLKSIT